MQCLWRTGSSVVYAKNQGKGKVQWSETCFAKQYYGIAFRAGSKLREDVNFGASEI